MNTNRMYEIRECFVCGSQMHLIPILLMTRETPAFPYSNFVSVHICEKHFHKLKKRDAIRKRAKEILNKNQ